MKNSLQALMITGCIFVLTGLSFAQTQIEAKAVDYTAQSVVMRGYLAYDVVLNGADDKFIPPEQIEAFKQEMKSVGADFRFISYPGAIHSFTNPDATELGKKFGMAVAYNAEADRKSWDEMKEFLNAVFKT